MLNELIIEPRYQTFENFEQEHGPIEPYHPQ